MKVDIEGMEIACLDSLLEMPQAELPKVHPYHVPTRTPGSACRL